ncbi:hypothetical protein ACIA5G_39520 [Amycolatopsis sp. NPDC051758]|uniref:hypothetical protein n=1 Tax=Amycolatopsis sp. NPDC051758 TaxID=3363935 RepID=UPI0037B5F74D
MFTTKTEGGLTKNTGWMNFENLQWAVYSPNSTSWLHGAYIAVKAGGWGTLEDGVQGRIDPLCRAPQKSQCTAVQPSNPADGTLVTLTSGTVYEVTWGETDASDVSTQPDKSLVRSDVGLRISGPGSGADVPAWSFDDDYLVGRCDARTTSTGNVSRGCVNHTFTPTLNLSVSTRGSSATMVDWAQTHLNWHPGKEGQGEPLHYKREYDDRRTVMCGAFVPDAAMNEALIPYNTKDSCDEYAFAASYENPANTGAIQDGAECAQVTAVQTDNTGVLATDWRDVTVLGNPTGAEKCVRGHIPLALNSAAGGDYGRLVTSARLIDNDPFWVAVNP